ncbi:GNAT family N-acetyltransferase [Lederbergia sp. NSJ-179]|uniref:GNAT family N-acetyltransferase n=1 Tax=Lederbergia sp. NSJ-179 TaxID=2931402 RepID=UPI001FD4B1F5|nr:GNAT family N-acetyltransferase [Lederbergia sp. NSJ-179]MCJ7842047.1 GNAT family N-acetyltransferase [Lederbergia sp. NSJ-179]
MHVKNMNEFCAREIMQWKYMPPYDFYNMDGEDEDLQELLHYSCVFQDDELIGFFCTGEFAQIHIGHEVGVYPEMEGLIDIGIGLKPEWTGKGFGQEFFSFIIQHLQKDQNPKALRLSVAQFNKRAVKLYSRLGFMTQTSFEVNNVPFLVMTKILSPKSGK